MDGSGESLVRTKQGKQFVFPVTTMRLGLVEDLEAENVVLEVLGKSLPRHLLADAFEVPRYIPLVRGVAIAFKALALTFNYDDSGMWLAVATALHKEVGIDAVLLIGSNYEVLRADLVSIPPEPIGLLVHAKGCFLLMFVVRLLFLKKSNRGFLKMRARRRECPLTGRT